MSLPSSPLDGLLSAFGSSASNFALATPDGRVRTYDTVTGRLRGTLSTGLSGAKGSAAALNGHLAEGQQCLAWVDAEAQSAEARSGNPAGPSSRSWLAVGTSAGGVKLYDSTTGELRWQKPNINEGGVSCLAFTPARSQSLLSSGPDGQAVSLDPSTGKKLTHFKASKHGASAAAISADGSKLLLGGSTLSLWDLDTQQRICRLTGHPLPVRALCFSPDAAYALSAAVGERLVAVWSVAARSGSSKKKAGGVAAASLAVAQPVVQLATTAAAESEPAGSFYLAATSESGEVSVWLIRPVQGDEARVDAQQVARLAVDPQHRQQEAIIAAALEPTTTGATLVAAVGSGAKPRFERIPIGSKAISSSKVTFLQPPPGSADLIRPDGVAAGSKTGAAASNQQGAGRTAVAAEVLGADNAGELVQQRVGKASRKRGEPEPDGADDQQQQQLGDAAAADGLANDAMADDDDQELSGEPTLGQRVLELESKVQQQHNAAAAGAVAAVSQPEAGADGAEAADAAGQAVLPSGPLKADSLAVLLSQALRSADKALLERCLGVSKERVITNSVKRLVPMDAALLLKAAVERLQTKPSRGQQLAAWIHAVLLHHTAYLMAAPAAAPLMSSLYQIIEARLAMQRQVLSLAGRLELLLAQRGPAGQAGAGVVAGGPQVVYQESDSEAEVEVVDAVAGEMSDDEYYTDEEGDEDEEEGSDDSSDEDDDEAAGDMDEDQDSGLEDE